jgi:hypothetical protein
MGKYGRAAIRAAELWRLGIAQSPQEAWDLAVVEVFPTPSSQDKACPKGAFLGLCEAGLVDGIDAGSYTSSQDNKRYAIDAVGKLRTTPSLANDAGELWRKVAGEKRPNSQMDVVIALWNAGLINQLPGSQHG